MRSSILAIDVREACKPTPAGKGQWAFGFVSELLRRSVDVALLTDAKLPHDWTGSPFAAFSARGARWHLQALAWLKRNPDVLYVSPVSYIVPALAPPHSSTVTVIHDLIAFRPDRHERRARMIERLTLPRAIARTRHLFSISESTRDDLLARYPVLQPSRVTVIGAGPMREHPPVAKPDRRTILCVGTLCPRKNQLRLIQAYARLPQNIRDRSRLVLAGGRGWDDGEIVDAAKSTPGVEWLGYVDGATYDQLMSQATVLALPSLYEGFGMQVLDALQRGVPVLTSDRGSLGEVAGGASVTVNPEDVGSIANGLERLLGDENLRSDLRQRGVARASQYSWSRTVDVFLDALRSRNLLG